MVARRRTSVVGRRHRPRPRARRPHHGRDPRARRARVAPLRGRAERRRDVEPDKPAKRMLEALWSAGRLVIAGAATGFQRMYDLPERVIPDEYWGRRCRASRGAAAAHRAALSTARGALTESGVVEHWRLRGRRRAGSAVRRRRSSPTAAPARGRWTTAARRCCCVRGEPEAARPAGVGAPLAVRQPALGPAVRRARARLPPPDRGLQAGTGAALRLLRPAAASSATAVVGRADVNADRKAGVLRLLAWHPESRRRSAARDEALERAFARLARQLALDPAS